MWKGFEEKHSHQPGRDKELVNQTADFPCRDLLMGEGDEDTLGRGQGNHNGGVFGSDRFIDVEDNGGGPGDGGANRESTFDFFDETVLSNSPIGNDVVSEFDDKRLVRNVDHLVQNGSIKYLETDLLREVV